MLGRADLLSFRLCSFTLCRLDFFCVPFSYGVWRRNGNSIVSIPDHFLYIYFVSVPSSSKTNCDKTQMRNDSRFLFSVEW